MSRFAIGMERVWKKFRRGDLFDSLRDLVPALAKRMRKKGKDFKIDIGRDDFWALKDISFQVQPGEAMGVIGPNGAGKSTMLKILSRILRPNAGHVAVNGRLSALIEVSAGFHQDLTGRENIYLNGSIMGMKKREIDKKLDEIIDFSGVREFIDTPVKRFSSGMQARLGFSIAAHLEPDILLVDEVLSVGDMQFQSRCVATMKDKLKKGTAIIFVSHNLPAVVDLCPKVMVLHHGELQFLGDSQKGVSRYSELVSSQELRIEIQELKILSASIKAPNGNYFKPGDPIEIELKMLFNYTVQCPTFNLIISRVSDNMILYDVAAQELGLAARTYEKGEVVKISFKAKANLLRGVYAVGFNVFVPSQQRFLMHKTSWLQFIVNETGSYQGIVDINCIAIEEIISLNSADADSKMHS